MLMREVRGEWSDLQQQSPSAEKQLRMRNMSNFEDDELQQQNIKSDFSPASQEQQSEATVRTES